jgi:iron complex outermembrane receptor protein
MRMTAALSVAGAIALGPTFHEPASAQETGVALPEVTVTASRTGTGIVGANNSVVTAQEIARSPAATLQDILAGEPGIQTWSLYGGVNGAGTSVDLRGFGATGASNTLVLVNGRRLTDIDLAGVDLSAIPRDSIERIEITRGNSGAVLYGDSAVGGVINIVTKNGAGLPPSARIEGMVGSFRQREGAASASASRGPWAMSVFANAFDSDGYRVNNALRQRNAVGDLRYSVEEGSAYLNISADDQHVGLPGARLVDPSIGVDQLATDRRGATTPTAFADKQGVNLTLGVTRNVVDGIEVIVDGGVRIKDQSSESVLNGYATADDRTLTTASFTPRFISRRDLMGLPSKVTAGFDFYTSSLDADRGALLSDPPVHRYNVDQTSYGVYWQQSVTVLPTTDVSYGARLQQTSVTARDVFDPTAPGGSFDVQGLPLDRTDAQYALHAGVEHRLNDVVTVFGRLARSFRTPNVDERVGQGYPTNFDLKTQTSKDAEAGVRVTWGPLSWQTSAYVMDLTNEIMFSPDTFSNTNLDPTRRRGVESQATYRLTDTVRLLGGVAYTHATFREGVNEGNDVPLVSRWTGTAGVSWDVWHKWLTVDLVTRFVGERRMDNDQRNVQPMIPEHALVDIRLGGQVDRFFWSFAVQNLFDEQYYDYAAASSSILGRYNAYPQPGRTYQLRAGMTF